MYIFFSFCVLSSCLKSVTWNIWWVIPLRKEREISMTSYHCFQKFYLLDCSSSPSETFTESNAQAFPRGNLLSYICVGQATWVVEWPICSHWQSPWEAGMATAKLNVLHSLHDHWEGKHQMAHPCCGPSMWKQWCRGRCPCARQTWQMSSTGKNKQHIRKLCFWSYLPHEGLGWTRIQCWLSWEGAEKHAISKQYHCIC